MKNFDIAILGGGSAGCGAAYALVNALNEYSGTGDYLRVALIDKLSILGGTSTASWVNCFAATPDAPYMKEFFEGLIKDGKAKYVDENYLDFGKDILPSIDYSCTLLHKEHRKDGKREASISVNVDSLSEKYYADLNASNNIEIMLGYHFKNAYIKEDGYIDKITLVKEDTSEECIIHADVFIDASGDSVLVRDVVSKKGYDYYVGADAFNRYEQTHGFIEGSGEASNIEEQINYPTLMYKVIEGQQEWMLDPLFGEDAMIYNTPNGEFFINSVSLLSGPGSSGIDVVNNGREYVYNQIKERTKYHWSTLKKSTRDKFKIWNLSNKEYVGYAPKLGIRETYRLNCERMLNENNLVKPFQEALSATSNLDKIIAIGNHSVDFHSNDKSRPHLNVVPYGVPFGTLIPKKLKNVLAASRGAGFTHIAAASFRLNKDMGQIGWAAGKAALLYLNGHLQDTRNIEVSLLWDRKYMDFFNTIQKIKNICD